MTQRDYNIPIKENEFVAIIKGEPYHSASWLQLEEFLREYDCGIEANEALCDGVFLLDILTCDTEQLIEFQQDLRRDRIPALWELYHRLLKREADYIIFIQEDE